MTQPSWLNGTVAAIMNPQSANGRTGRIWPQIHAELRKVFGDVQVFHTQSPQHAINLTAAAIQAGHRTILAIGGDGTINEVVNGLLSNAGAASEVVLGVIPQGTGSDFRRALRLPVDEKAAIRAIQTADARPVDVMRVAYGTSGGNTATRYAVNVVSFGIGGAVAARVNRTSKALGGKVSFLMATVMTTLAYRGKRVSLRIDGAEPRDVSVTNVSVGNGPFHGGGMWACPRSVMDDGLLEVTIIENMPAWEIFRDIRFLYNGRIYEHPKVRYSRATRLEATSDEPTLLEIDGEPLGQLPLEIEVLPKAIRVLRL